MDPPRPPRILTLLALALVPIVLWEIHLGQPGPLPRGLQMDPPLTLPDLLLLALVLVRVFLL